jgi:hypothetical protein
MGLHLPPSMPAVRAPRWPRPPPHPHADPVAGKRPGHVPPRVCKQGRRRAGLHAAAKRSPTASGVIEKDRQTVGVAGSEPRQAWLFESVSEYVSPVARVDLRTQESQRGCNGLSSFGPIDALRPAVDNPYIQEPLKSWGYKRVYRR